MLALQIDEMSQPESSSEDERRLASAAVSGRRLTAAAAARRAASAASGRSGVRSSRLQHVSQQSLARLGFPKAAAMPASDHDNMPSRNSFSARKRSSGRALSAGKASGRGSAPSAGLHKRRSKRMLPVDEDSDGQDGAMRYAADRADGAAKKRRRLASRSQAEASPDAKHHKVMIGLTLSRCTMAFMQ